MEFIRNYSLCGAIAIIKNASENEVYAARELRAYLELITGHPVELSVSDVPVENAQIIVGSALPLYGQDRISYEDDEFQRYEKNGKLFMDGGCRGLLYGMYDLLETLGCRFFTATCEKIPVIADYELKNTDFRDKPAFTYREMYYGDSHKAPFANKCRVNGNFPLPKNTGGSIRYGLFAHSFTQLVPYKVYHKDHPDWFAEINGTRATGEVNPNSFDLCLSNPEVTEILIEQTRKFLLEHPDARIMSISQNDNLSACQCEKCRAIIEEEGSAAGLMLRVVNAVAEALEDEFPNILFETFAYIYTRTPPKYARPRRNVSIRLCTIECCFFHPLDSRCTVDGHGTHLADDIAGWGKICDKLAIWDYVTTFHHYLIPHPNWRVLQPNIQFFHRNNAYGLFEQGNINGSGGADLEELRCYVITKLMWNPYRDMQELITEFTDYYYGAAGPIIREYIDTLCNACEECNVHIGCYQKPWSDYLEPKYLATYNEILDRARAAVEKNYLLVFRIEKLRLSLRYTDLYQRMVSDATISSLPVEMNEFFEDCRTHGITGFTESTSVRGAIRSFTEHIKRCKGLD